MKKIQLAVLCAIIPSVVIFFIWRNSPVISEQMIGKVGDYIETANSGNFKIVSITDAEIGIEKQKGYGPWIIPAVPGEGYMGNYEYLIVDEVNHENKEFTYRIRRRRPSHPLDF